MGTAYIYYSSVEEMPSFLPRFCNVCDEHGDGQFWNQQDTRIVLCKPCFIETALFTAPATNKEESEEN